MSTANPDTGADPRVADDTADLPRHPLLPHRHVDGRSASLAVIAVIAGLFAMQWAKSLLIPILLGVMFSYALAPLVNQLQRWRLPRPIGAAVLLSSIVSALAWGVWTLSDEASALVETLPQVTQKLRQLTEGGSGPASTIEKVQQAAIEIQRAAVDSVPALPTASASGAGAADAVAPPRTSAGSRDGGRAAGAASASAPERVALVAPTRVVIESTGFNIRDYLLTGTLGVFAFLGQAAIVLLIMLFLLSSGTTFRRKMVKLAGPRLSQKRSTVNALNEITEQIQRYLLVQLAVSVLVGVLTGLTFYALGVNQSAVWGVVAAVGNLIPYVGAVAVGTSAGLVASLQFASIDMALLVTACSFGIRAVVGNLLTPWLTGKASRMSPFAVFVGVIAFGWLWGAWGLFLGVPILMVVKSICDRVDDLNPIGELLGR